MSRLFIRNPLQWYTQKLDSHPIATKVITSGLISGSGDLLCQYLSTKKDNEIIEDEKQHNNSYDWRRTINFTILGGALVAPTVHVWYGYLMSSIPGSSITAIGKRLFMDQGLFAPIFLPTFVSCLTVLEHINLNSNDDTTLQSRNNNSNNDNDLISHISNRLRNDVPDAIVVGWKIWVPSMTIMFALIPGKFQVLYSNCIGFVWNAYLSWRTHEGEKE